MSKRHRMSQDNSPAIGRRNFLKGATLAAVAAITATPGAKVAMPATEPERLLVHGVNRAQRAPIARRPFDFRHTTADGGCRDD
jgi:hypothetical protein